MSQKNLVWHLSHVQKEQRAKQKKQKPCVLWFTGLSGSGKSTLANGVESRLHELNCHTYLLDGDNIRSGLNSDLGFDRQARVENIRRIGELAKLFIDSGTILLSAFISPFEADRAFARGLVEKDEFIEIFVDTPLEVCESRDTKGLYKKAREGKIEHFTGITSPYERAQNPELHIVDEDIAKNIELIINYLKNKGYIDVK